MNILKELTKDFRYEENVVNPDLRKVTSGPFRGVTVNRNGICYSRIGRTMKISSTGFYKSLEGKAVIKPWRLCALVWHDQSPSFHFEDGKDKYLNLLTFLRLSDKYNDYYEKNNEWNFNKILSINKFDDVQSINWMSSETFYLQLKTSNRM